MSEKDPNKSYVAILGWSLKAIEAADSFNRRYIVVAPPWAALDTRDVAPPQLC